MTVTGLPGSGVTDAWAANKVVISGGKRCDKFHLGREFAKSPSNSGFPAGPDNFDIWKGDPKNYNYDLPGKAFDGLKAPTAADKARVASKFSDAPTPGKQADRWSRYATKTGKPEDRATAIYARFLATGRPDADFTNWFTIDYVGKQENNRKGAAFEGRLVKDFNLVGPDWLCEVDVKVYDENGKLIASRRYDAYNKRTLEFNEFKSNSKPRDDQLRADRTILKEKPDHTLRYTGGKKWDQEDADKIKQLDKDVSAERGKTNQVRGFQRQYNGVARTVPIRGYSREDRWFAPDPNKGTRGPANDRAYNSPPTPEDARRQQGAARRIDVRGTLPRGGPGGVDFSTLELRYVGTPVKGRGMDYSMHADLTKNPDTNPSWGGKEKMDLASDAFFTWLALTPDKMWVNLNPDQPDRIMDSAFAKTDAGRVLLQADMEMKHDYARAMNPDTPAGKRFWYGISTVDGKPCMNSTRNWITPRPAKVREQDGGIYILDAPLKVQSVAQDYNTPGPGGSCKLSKEQIRHNMSVLNREIIPIVEKKVNSDPFYADLRRVYTSRVAAEWIRRQDAKNPTDFHKIIDSNDLKRWPLRGKNKNWDKKTVYDEMVRSYKNGDFKYKLPVGGTVYIYTVGGVDFSKSPKRNITSAQFGLQYRTLDTTTKTSLRSDDTSYRDTDELYIGGNAAGATGGGDQPTPTPTPSHTGEPSPTHHPGSPPPNPTHNGGTHPSPPATKDPNGDLAHTGSDIPIGLITGMAAALVALGGGLVWWMRRRKTSPR
ncbi:hypothetical protein [Streptomyces sp. S186]|uniref:hypothetical protein n=1 Tax=Streptomyces sp. S186 TaxID=3434395 RepID=UPI003F6690AC